MRARRTLAKSPELRRTPEESTVGGDMRIRAPLSAQRLLELQRTAGNSAVTHLLESRSAVVGVQREVTDTEDTEADEDFEGGEEAEDYNFDFDDEKEGGINFAPEDAGPLTKSEMKQAAKNSTPSRSNEEWEAFNERQAAWEAHMEKINPRTADEDVVRHRSELQDRWGGGSGQMAVDMGLAAPPKSRFRRMLSRAKKGLQKGSKWALKKAGLGQEQQPAVAAPIPLTPEERQKRRAFKIGIKGDDQYW
jgi:hypothetical protein